MKLGASKGLFWPQTHVNLSPDFTPNFATMRGTTDHADTVEPPDDDDEDKDYKFYDEIV